MIQRATFVILKCISYIKIKLAQVCKQQIVRSIVESRTEHNLLDAAIYTNEIFSQVAITVFFILSCLLAGFKLDKILFALFVQDLFYTGFLFFVKSMLVKTPVQLLIHRIISSVSKEFFLVVAERCKLAFEAFDE